MDKERAAKAMADPEIQAILRDPVVQQTLQDCQADPTKLRKVRGTRLLRGLVCACLTASATRVPRVDPCDTVAATVSPSPGADGPEHGP